MEKDKLDFRNMSVGKLFIKQFIPTLLGMVSSALFIIVDGIFVGRGIGPEALGAVNIVVPLSMITTGLGLMFGMGGSILASINLARGKQKVANINFTQAFIALIISNVLFTVVVLISPTLTASLLGANAELIQPAVEYMVWFTLFLTPLALTVGLPFFVRLGNPNYAMWCMLTGTVVNLVLDYVFIFPLGWGLTGAAVATGIGELISAALLIAYFFRKGIPVHLEKIKLSAKRVRLSIRNTGYMVKLGIPAFLSELTIAAMAMTGNLAFIHYLGTEGVAAFSVVCYLFPVIFMLFNATVQSVQPIISYNYGCGQPHRSIRAVRLAMVVAVLIGMAMFTGSLFHSGSVVSLFIPDSGAATWSYATLGLPLFAIDFAFFGFNIVMIGYYTSIEKIKRALFITLLRGILPVFLFWVLPELMSTPGLWLAVPISDIVTTFFITLLCVKDKLVIYADNNRNISTA